VGSQFFVIMLTAVFGEKFSTILNRLPVSVGFTTQQFLAFSYTSYATSLLRSYALIKSNSCLLSRCLQLYELALASLSSAWSTRKPILEVRFQNLLQQPLVV
jgi:hypothetical protein